MNVLPHGATDAGLIVHIADVEVVLRPSGALWAPQERMLVAADLHLEKGSAYARKGQLLPPYDTRETLDRLTREIAALKPRTVVLLGDTLHDHDAEMRIAETEKARIAALSDQVRLVWICGNHDPDGAGGLGGETATVIEASGLTLRHEPSTGSADGEVSGHLHPCVRIAGAAGSIRRRCFASDGSRLILPAFGAYAGGLNLRDEAFSHLFSTSPTGFLLGRRLTAVAFEKMRPDRPFARTRGAVRGS